VALQQDHPEDQLVKFLDSNEELFGGQGNDLLEFRSRYLEALDRRVSSFQSYLDDPNDANETASEIASGRAEFLNQVTAQLLEVAVFYQLKRRFSDAFLRIAAAALVVVACAAAYAWASSKPASASPPKPLPPPMTARSPDCVAYYLKMDRLADDDFPTRKRPAKLFPLDPEAKACGFRSAAQLTTFVVYLSRR
jgi:hypothetical protein